MIYNEKYNRYIDNDCVIYRKNKEGKLVQVKPSVNNCGYEFICYDVHKIVYVHKLVYETFKGEIPEGLEIDHIDRNKLNNNPDNLRVVTRSENMKNRGKFTSSRSIKGNIWNKGNSYRKGVKLSKETKQKISANNGRGMLGRNHSDETKRKMSEKQKKVIRKRDKFGHFIKNWFLKSINILYKTKYDVKPAIIVGIAIYLKYSIKSIFANEAR